MESELNIAAAANATGYDCEYIAPRAHVHSLLDVLMPANPPEPKNARIVRLFDIEAAQSDPRPVATHVVDAISARREARNSRRASRDLRRQSLAAAAGLG